MNVQNCMYLLLALTLGAGIAGCASTKSAETSSESKYLSNPDYEIEPYLVEDEASLILKVRPEAWGEVEPLVSGALGTSVAGESLQDWSSAAQKGPFALASSLFGVEWNLEHLDRSRASYLAFSPRRHNPWQGCLSAGLPCVLFEAPGPRYGRLILPSKRPAELAAGLEKAFGEGNYRIVEMEYHVRVEFATTDVQADTIDEHLEVRVADKPEDDYYGRQSPARAAILRERVSFGAYANLRALLDASMYLRAHRLADDLGDTPLGQRMREVLDQTIDIARLTHLDLPDQAEVEDVSLVARGSKNSHTLRLFSTRTRFGNELSEKRDRKVELPEPSVDGPAVGLEWNAQFASTDDAVKPREWLARSDREGYPTLTSLGELAWLGWWRAPSAVAASLADRLQGRLGVDLSNFVAGRLAVARAEGDGPGDWGAFRGGGVLLVDSASKSAGIPAALARAAEWIGPMNGKLVERSDGRVEVRIALNAPVEKVFPDGGTRSVVGPFALDAPRKPARALWKVARENGLDAYAPATARVLETWIRNGPVELGHASDENWSAIEIKLGPSAPKLGSFDAPSFEVRQVSAYCLDSAAQKTAEWMARALRANEVDAFLAERFESKAPALRSSITDCDGDDPGESDLAMWGGDFFDAWWALTEYRVGRDRWKERIGPICDEGHEWACNPDRGSWPWIGPSDTSENSEASGPSAGETDGE